MRAPRLRTVDRPRGPWQDAGHAGSVIDPGGTRNPCDGAREARGRGIPSSRVGRTGGDSRTIGPLGRAVSERFEVLRADGFECGLHDRVVLFGCGRLAGAAIQRAHPGSRQSRCAMMRHNVGTIVTRHEGKWQDQWSVKRDGSSSPRRAPWQPFAVALGACHSSIAIIENGHATAMHASARCLLASRVMGLAGHAMRQRSIRRLQVRRVRGVHRAP